MDSEQEYLQNQNRPRSKKGNEKNKKEKNKRKIKPGYIIAVVLLLLFVPYLVFQIIAYKGSPIKTESALLYTHDETIKGTVFVIRDEELLDTGDVSGVLSYSVDNGSRVSAGGVVADIFKTDAQAAAHKNSVELQKKIDKLTRLSASGKYFSSDPSLINSKISERLDKLLKISDHSNIGGYKGVAEDLLELMNELQMATGETSDFATVINGLKAKKAQYDGDYGKETAQITSPVSGYFVNKIDGYENILTTASVEKLTPDDLEKAASSTPKAATAKNAGKVIAGYEWYAAMNVKAEKVKKLTVGKSIEMVFPGISDKSIPVTVTAVNYDKTQENVALVMKCSYMNSALSSVRMEEAEIKTSSYRGIRVRDESIRIIDGRTGVYKVSGITARFVPVDVICSYTGYTLCEYTPADTSGLRIYDEIIIEGRDIYDGKAVR